MFAVRGSEQMSPRRPTLGPMPIAHPHPTRVAVISPAPLEREGLKLVLEDAGFAIAIEAEDLAAIPPALADDNLPELFVVDVSADGNLAEWREQLGVLRHRFPQARIVLLSNRLTPDWWLICSQLDLDGYLSKVSRPLVFKRQLELIVAGERMFPFEIFQESSAVQPGSAVTERGAVRLSQLDEQILRHLLAGHSNRIIATRLQVTESTVKARMKSVFQKIHANNRTQAAVWALKHGMTPVNDGV